MMRSEPITQERVYRELKADLFAGVYQLRERMDLTTLARRYGASKTPLREALFRLVAERLLTQHPQGGYQIGVPDAARLADLYFWNAQHLLAALHVTSEKNLNDALQPFRNVEIAADTREQIGLLASLFRAVGAATGNVEFIDHIQAANERLFYPRLAEANLFMDTARELAILFNFAERDVQKNARRRILTYHRRRVEHASRIAAMWVAKAKLGEKAEYQ